MATETFSQTAKRIKRSASFVVNASIENAFPMFGPIREKDWCVGWEPQVIYSVHPEVEQHMIFKTNANNPKENEYLWVVTQFKPSAFLIEYTVSTPIRIWFITVTCKPQNEKTFVTVSYSYTGLTEEGVRLNQLALEKMFAQNLKDWEEAVNFYVETGKRLE